MNRTFQNAFKAVLVVSTLGNLTLAGRAELPPSAYQKMKTQAPEVVEIQVTKVNVTTQDGKDRQNVSVKAVAKVTHVTRSASKLKAGSVISLNYTTFQNTAFGWAGPSPVAIVQPGKRYRAWLKKSGASFQDAAGGQSLEQVK